MANRSHLRVVPDLVDPLNPTLTIDCHECIMQFTPVCDDCLVTHIVGREIGEPVEFEGDEARAVRLLAEAGLVPGSRFEKRLPVA